MKKLDHNLTRQIQDWLAKPKGQRNIIAGAELMLSLNRNRALYLTIIRKPAKYEDKLEYELKKFLRIRLDGMTTESIRVFEKEVIPKVEETIKKAEEEIYSFLEIDREDTQGPPSTEDGEPVISTDDELPKAKIQKGKRADHEQLPDNIKKLWDDNFDLYSRINLLFEDVKALNNAQPCDRYEKLKMLADADEKYRNNLQKYDEYVIGSEPEKEPLTDEQRKKISAARKSLSTYRQRLSSGDGITDEQRSKALEKIQESVNTIVSLGGTFTDEMIEELNSLDIDIPQRH